MVYEHMAKSWGFMVSTACLFPKVLVDTTNSKIIITGELVINIDGGLPQSHLVPNQICFILTLNGGQVTNWEAYWNNADPVMLQALATVSTALKVAKGDFFVIEHNFKTGRADEWWGKYG